MIHQSDARIEVEVDDEHPFFTVVWEQSKALRKPPAPDADPIAALTAELRIGDTVQPYSLEHVSDLKWHDNRAHMLTRWRPAGNPKQITSTTTPKGDKKA